MVGGLKGVDNVYTQHQPLLSTTLDNILKCKLKDTEYPYAGPGLGPKDRPQDILVFIVGGATYEEARAVQMLNVQAKKEGSTARFILGGTSVINSRGFTDVRKRTPRVAHPIPSASVYFTDNFIQADELILL